MLGRSVLLGLVVICNIDLPNMGAIRKQAFFPLPPRASSQPQKNRTQQEVQPRSTIPTGIIGFTAALKGRFSAGEFPRIRVHTIYTIVMLPGMKMTLG